MAQIFSAVGRGCRAVGDQADVQRMGLKRMYTGG
jgi:hypothetical protein